jgi:hypothetical protein
MEWDRQGACVSGKWSQQKGGRASVGCVIFAPGLLNKSGQGRLQGSRRSLLDILHTRTTYKPTPISTKVLAPPHRNSPKKGVKRAHPHPPPLAAAIPRRNGWSQVVGVIHTTGGQQQGVWSGTVP